MNKLHKKMSLNLIQKLYIVFVLFVIFGWYKNAWVPYREHFYSFSHLLLVFLYPVIGFLMGALFDYLFKNRYSFNNKFYGFLFSLLIPISTNISIFILFLTVLLFFNTFLVSRKDWDLNFIVLGKLALVFLLARIGEYQYANLLEESGLFVYSYLDSIFGHNVSELFTSSVLLTFVAFFFFCFDLYYKKEIPFYSYGFYLLTLVVYAFWKSDMGFILTHLFSSSVCFALVIVAPLSSFSPYSKKRLAFYGILLGCLILPFSLLTNFQEGVYIAIIIVNLILIFLNTLQLHFIRSKLK